MRELFAVLFWPNFHQIVLIDQKRTDLGQEQNISHACLKIFLFH